MVVEGESEEDAVSKVVTEFGDAPDFSILEAREAEENEKKEFWEAKNAQKKHLN